MNPARKRMTFATILGAVTIYSGILADVPALILNIIVKGPDWLLHPNTIWFLGISSITAAVLYWIWTCQQDDDTDCDFDLKREITKAANTSSRCLRIFMLAQHFEIFRNGLLKMPEHVVDVYVSSHLEVVFPPQIESVLGKNVRDCFVAMVQDAKNKSKLSFVVADAAGVYLNDILTSEMMKEYEKAAL